MLNATLFILIGLQLPVIVESLEGRGAGELIGYSALVCAAVIGVRFAWFFTMPYVIRAIDRRPQQRERRVGPRERIVGAWAGIRGAVSLAAALALPFETDAGAPLPDRDLVLFITFAVILVTLVGQGLTLPALLRRLGCTRTAPRKRRRRSAPGWSHRARRSIGSTSWRVEEWTRDDTVERTRGLYRFRMRRFEVRAGKLEDEDGIEDRSIAYQRLQHELYLVQRRALVELRNEGAISNEVMHRIERELDLEESRLEV